MKDLNVRKETIKILENIDSNLFDISHSNFLIYMYPKARGTKAKINYWGPHQDKKLLHSERNNQQN